MIAGVGVARGDGDVVRLVQLINSKGGLRTVGKHT